MTNKNKQKNNQQIYDIIVSVRTKKKKNYVLKLIVTHQTP